MSTIRVVLTSSHLNKARALVLSGEGDGTIFADAKADGLILRVRKSVAAFAVKWNGKTRAIGRLSVSADKAAPGEVGTISRARELAGEVRALLRDGTDPTAFLTGKAAGKSRDAATVAAGHATNVAAGLWVWEKLVQEYTEGYLAMPRVAKGGRIRQPSTRSVRTARSSLSVPEADFLKGKLLTEIEEGDFEKVRDDCSLSGRKTASRAFVTNARAAMSFAKRKHKKMSGLGGIPPWWLGVEILDETAVASRTRMPTVKELATTLYLAESNRVLQGRKSRRGTSETVLCGLWWIALTAQRTSAGFSLEQEHILPWPQGPKGWMICLWTDVVMKSRRYHALPIPPRVVMLLNRTLSGRKRDSRYVFAGTATRQGQIDRPISISSPKNLLERLRGRPASLGKRGSEVLDGLPDLLAASGIAHFSPHDIRRTFATACSDRSVRGDAISAVLDHVGIDTGQKLVRSAEITRLAYDYSQKLELKALAMEAWTTALFAATDEVWEASRPRVNPFRKVPPPKPRQTKEHAIRFSSAEPWYSTMERMQSAARAKLPPLSTLSSQSVASDEVAFEPDTLSADLPNLEG